MIRPTVISFFILILPIGQVIGQEDLILNSIRNELFYSEFDLDKGVEFYDKIVSHGNLSPSATVTAYQASAEALIAKFSWNPIRKLNRLRNAMCLLDKAVMDDATNVEIRFLRFYIQNSVPAYLGYRKNTDEDRDAIAENIHKVKDIDISIDIFNYINDYMSGFGIADNSVAVAND